MAIAKTLRTRNVAGMSLFFLIVVELGYLAGILSQAPGPIRLGRRAMTVMNFAFVGFEIILYLRYSKLDRPSNQVAEDAGDRWHAFCPGDGHSQFDQSPIQTETKNRTTMRTAPVIKRAMHAQKLRYAST